MQNVASQASLSTRLRVALASLPFSTRCALFLCLATHAVVLLAGFDGMVQRGCLSARDVMRGQVYRLFTSALMHGSLLHLALNMLALCQIGPPLERALGSLQLAWLMLLSCLLGGALYTAAAYVAAPLPFLHRFAALNFLHQCAVGFSGVLFSLLLVDASLNSAPRSVFGLVTVPARLYPWLLAAVWQLVVPQASLLGHLSGLAVGLLYCRGLLRWAMPPSAAYHRLERSAACARCFHGASFIAHTGGGGGGGDEALPVSRPPGDYQALGAASPRGASWLPFMPFPSSSSRLADLFGTAASQAPPGQQQAGEAAPPQGVRLGGAQQPADPKQAAAQAAEARLARGPGGGKKGSGGSGASGNAARSQLVQDIAPTFEDDVVSAANFSVSLDPGVPQLTFWSDVLLPDGCTAPDASACAPLQWLTAALRDVYEVDASGRRVPQRGGADVLNTTGLEWEPRDTQAGSPAVPVAEAGLRAPFLAALPPCPGGGGGVDPDASGGVAFTAQLFGGAANLTYGNSSQELLAGNLRWSVEVVQWPFCDPSHSLVLSFALLPASAGDSQAGPAEVRGGADIQQQVAEQEALLTGQADPQSVPVDGGAEPPPDAAAALGSADGLLADSGLSADGGSGNGGRRLLQRRGGGFGIIRRPATRPSGPAPTATAGPTRPYFPNGGTSRPRFTSPAAAVTSLPFTAAQRPFLASRYYYNRPVYGFGSTFLFFPFFLGSQRYRTVAPAVDIQGTAVINGTTLVNVSIAVPEVEAAGVQPVLVTVPFFQGSLVFDSVAAITDSDLLVSDGIQAAIDEAMAYGGSGGGNPNAASAHRPPGLLLQTALAVAAAAAALVLT